MKQIVLALLLGASLIAPAQTKTYVATSDPIAVFGMKYQGAYSSITTYSLNDVVLSGGVTYISILNGNIGHTPVSSPSQWSIVGGSASLPSGTGLVQVSGGTGGLATHAVLNALDQQTNGRVVYNKTAWANISDFTASGQATTLTNGQIVFNPSTPNSYTAQQLFLTSFISPDENNDFDVTFVVGTTSGSGIAFVRKSISPFAVVGEALQFNPVASTMTISAVSGTTFTTLATTALSATPVVGDVIHVVFSQRVSTFYAIADNYTQQTHDKLTAGMNVGVVIPVTNAIVNSAQWGIAGFGGTFSIRSLSVTSRQPTNPDICVVGDSKDTVYMAGNPSQRWASNLSLLGSVADYAGGGDGTAEALADVPYILAAGCKKVLLNIGRNDIANGVSTGTMEANYSSIVTALTAGGAVVTHLLPIPETAVSQTVLTNYINTTYPSAPKLDVTSGWSNGTYLASDGVHPNALGHAYIASQVIGSGLFPFATTPYIASAASPFSLYGDFPFGVSSNLPASTTIGGKAVCLADGTNCPSAGAVVYLNTIFNEHTSGNLATTTPATCTAGSGCTWVLPSGTDFTYQSGGGVATSTPNSNFDLINTGHTDETIRWAIPTCSGTGGAPCQLAIRYTNISNFIAVTFTVGGGVTVTDVVAGTGTVIGSIGAGTNTGNYTIIMSGTTVNITNVTGTTGNMTTGNTGTLTGMLLGTGTAMAVSSLSAKSF